MNARNVHRHLTYPTFRLGRRAPVRALGLALAVVLLASLLAPLAPAVSADDPAAAEEAIPALQDDGASEDPTASGEGNGGDSGDGGAVETPAVEETPDAGQTPAPEETPIPETPVDPTPVPDETPVVEETPDARLTGDPEGGTYTHYVDVIVWECASDYGGDRQQLLDNCEIADDIPIEFYAGGSRQQTAKGTLHVEDLPDGQYALRQHLLPGYGQPMAFCALAPNDWFPVPAAYYSRDDQEVNEGRYQFSLGVDADKAPPSDMRLVCDWFNVRLADASAAAVMVSRFCPADFDPANAGYADFAAACLGEQDGVTFEILDDGFLLSHEATSGSPSQVARDDLPAGRLTFKVFGYGQVAVFCKLNGSDYQPVAGLVTAPDNSAHAFEATLQPGETLTCEWYQVSEPTRLTVYPYVCPEDAAFDYYAADGDALDARCEGSEIAIDLTGQTGETQTKSATSEGGTVGAYFETAPAGLVTVTAHARAGYGTPRVFCGVASQNGVVFFDVELHDRSAGFEIPSAQTVLCFWFDIPGGDGEVNVYVTKHACPAEVDADSADLGTMRAKCPAMEGVTFSVFDEDAKVLGSGQTSTDFGQIAFDDLPAGDLLVVEEYPEGYGLPVVFCRLTDAGGQGTDYQLESVWVSEDSAYLISKTLKGGETLECEWFNVPDHEDDGEIMIYKSFCPNDGEVDYDGADLEYLKDYCEYYYGDDVMFDLYHEGTGETETRATGSGYANSALWGEVHAGEVTITEHPWDGYGSPIVFCDVTTEDGEYEFFDVDLDDRSAGFEVPRGELVRCWWFNIPDDGGTVTVVKLNCPKGVGYQHGGIERYAEACDEPAAGVSFKLDGERTGNPGDEPTDADGVVSWGGREADHYYLYEELPTGFGKPVVFCDSYYPLDERPPAWDGYAPEHTPDAAPFTYRIEFGLSEGQSILCYWFNVPHDDLPTDKPGTLTVVKYWCEGSTVSALNCALYGGGQTFRLTQAGGGKDIELTTGGTGKTSVTVSAGTWALDEVGREWCRAESAAVTADGDLLVRPGRETVVTVYNCGKSGPGTPQGKQPPTELPNTGRGAAAGSLTLGGGTGAGEALGLLFAAGAVLGLARLSGAAARRRAAVHAW